MEFRLPWRCRGHKWSLRTVAGVGRQKRTSVISMTIICDPYSVLAVGVGAVAVTKFFLGYQKLLNS